MSSAASVGGSALSIEREAFIEQTSSDNRVHLWMTDEMLTRISEISGLDYVFQDNHHAQRVLEHLLELGLAAKEAELEAERNQQPLF